MTARTAAADPAAPVGPAPDPAAVHELSEQVVRLTRTSHALRSRIAARGSDDGVEWSAYTLLFQLVREGPKRSSALAEASCVDPSTISRQVGQLVRRRLVERQADPVDGRAVLLAPTDEGRRVYAAMQDRRDLVFARMVADWPTEDVRTLAALLARLNRSFLPNRAQLVDALAGVRTPEETA
jgi:DNA-binding MarR family transcriptional regulator